MIDLLWRTVRVVIMVLGNVRRQFRCAPYQVLENFCPGGRILFHDVYFDASSFGWRRRALKDYHAPYNCSAK